MCGGGGGGDGGVCGGGLRRKLGDGECGARINRSESDGTIKRQTTTTLVSARFTSPPLALLEEAQRREEVQPVEVVVDSGLQQVVL